MGLREKAREFAEAVRQTREFNDLKQAKAAIDRNRELKQKMDSFTKRQKELYFSGKPAKEIEPKLAQLNKEYESLSKIPEVENFLKALHRFNEMMVNVYKSINQSIESGLK